jgi:hypothetical protein
MPGSRALHESGWTPTSPTATASEPKRRAPPAAAETRRRAGLELLPGVLRPGRAPQTLRLPVTAAATARAKANATAAQAAATTTAALPGARRGLMLSSAAPPPLWAPRAAAILHILEPSPSGPRPRLAGSGHAPFPSRDGARGRRESCFLCKAGANPAGTSATTFPCRTGADSKSPPHAQERPPDADAPPRAEPADPPTRGPLDR